MFLKYFVEKTEGTISPSPARCNGLQQDKLATPKTLYVKNSIVQSSLRLFVNYYFLESTILDFSGYYNYNIL